MNMARSTYYYELKKTDAVYERNDELSHRIAEIFNNHKSRYGVRRVYHELVNMGYHVNHKRVQRLMKEMNLAEQKKKRKYHSYKGDIGKTAPNIIDRNFNADEPLMKWTTDVTQFNFSWGKCYMSPILDMFTNEIISYDLSRKPDLAQVSRMLDAAFTKFPETDGLIFHSDQGWQYQHESYQSTLKEHGIIQSMSRKGNCYDNCIMETFFGRMKNEMYYDHESEYKSFKEFSEAVKEYIYYYNNERIQAKTKWMPPTVYRLASTC